MLEFNTALQKCGFETEAKMIHAEDITKVKFPSIVLHYPKNKANKLGHFFIIIPHDNQITIYDYPHDVQTYPADFLVSSLKQNDIDEFPIIMCKSKRKLTEGKSSQKATKVESEIIFKGFDKQLMGSVDFSSQPESSLVECSFRLVNRSAAAIELKNIVADCKCSKIHIDKTSVSPGDFCKITMDISLTKKYKDVAVRGRATINQANGDRSTNLMMLVKGYSEPRVLCNPQKINFGTIKTNSGLAKLEGIKILKTKFSKDKKISIKPTASKIKIVNIKQNTDSIEFDVTLDSRESIGFETSKINVFLGNESEPANYFDVMFLSQLDFALSPKVVIAKKDKTSIVTVTPKEQELTVEKSTTA